MPYRKISFISGGFYHIFNRGVEKRIIFTDNRDYQRFLQTLYYYQFKGPKPKFSNRDRFKDQSFKNNTKIAEVICYCLMPNHFHILVRQIEEDGIKEYMQKVINSYTKYFNTKYNRVGHLFQGVFKAVSIDTDEQLLQVSRYIHLNPFNSKLIKELTGYPYSSYLHFIGFTQDKLCSSLSVLNFFKGFADYHAFVESSASYTQEIGLFVDLLIDPEEKL